MIKILFGASRPKGSKVFGTKTGTRAEERAAEKVLRDYVKSTAKIDWNLQRVKKQLVREGLMTPEQIRAIERKATRTTEKMTKTS